MARKGREVNTRYLLPQAMIHAVDPVWKKPAKCEPEKGSGSKTWVRMPVFGKYQTLHRLSGWRALAAEHFGGQIVLGDDLTAVDL